MGKFKKNGSILIRNIFFMSIIFMLSISILNFQRVTLKTLRSVLFTNKFSNHLDIIKNEIYFNKQYLYIDDGVYINEHEIDLQIYENFNEIFKKNDNGDENYFYIELDSSSGIVNISYFQNKELLFSDVLKI